MPGFGVRSGNGGRTQRPVPSSLHQSYPLTARERGLFLGIARTILFRE